MRKNLFLGAASLVLAASLLAGCGNGGASLATGDAGTAAETQGSTEAVLNSAVPAPTDYVSEADMQEADKWPSCDDRALAAVMRKASSGEKVTIACIGGSITEGSISGGTKDSEVADRKCYADIFFEWWKETFPDTEFDFVNAGIGGTDSYLGVHRVQSDVLDKNPDLVLVEFSVNDRNSLFYKQSYDNLVRKILRSENRPAVMLLFMAQPNGNSAQENHVFVGYGYKLPMLSYGNLIRSYMDNGVYTEKELSGDEVHPSALGHAITGEMLWKYLNGVYENCKTMGEPDDFDTAPVTKELYLDGTVLDSRTITPDETGTFELKNTCGYFPYGWKCSAGDGGITFTAEFKNLGILYLATTDGAGGQFELYVDGEYVNIMNADNTGGWGNAIKADQMYTSGERAKHTVTIKKSADSQGDVFDLLGLLTS